MSTLTEDQAHSALLNLIYSKHKSFNNLCIIALEKVLILAKSNTLIKDYIKALPSPNYVYLNYVHWAKSFV